MMSEWDGYILEDYRYEFLVGSQVLDVGCGTGDQLAELRERGHSALGVDIAQPALEHCRERGLNVRWGTAEQLPFDTAHFDGLICKVVLPYTEEEQAISEIARVLKPTGRAYLSGHGAGYFLFYLLRPPQWKFALYGLRSLVNTWWWLVTGRRLPGFVGDTLYQSRRRLAKYYAAHGLRLVRDDDSPRFLGAPVFIYQVVERI